MAHTVNSSTKEPEFKASLGYMGKISPPPKKKAVLVRKSLLSLAALSLYSITKGS